MSLCGQHRHESQIMMLQGAHVAANECPMCAYERGKADGLTQREVMPPARRDDESTVPVPLSATSAPSVAPSPGGAEYHEHQGGPVSVSTSVPDPATSQRTERGAYGTCHESGARAVTPVAGSTPADAHSIFGLDPDFTDGLPAAEWLKRRWAGEPPPSEIATAYVEAVRECEKLRVRQERVAVLLTRILASGLVHRDGFPEAESIRQEIRAVLAQDVEKGK